MVRNVEKLRRVSQDIAALPAKSVGRKILVNQSLIAVFFNRRTFHKNLDQKAPL